MLKTFLCSPQHSSILLLLALIVTFSVHPPTAAAQDAISISSLAYSPDGTMIAVSGSIAGENGTNTDVFAVRVLDASTGQVMKRLLGMTSPSTSVSWSPDHRKLASLSISTLSEVYIWDVANEELLLTFPVLTQGTFEVHWSPRGDLLAVTTLGGAAILYDTDTGEDVGAAGGTTVDWSPDGQHLVSGSVYDNFVLIEEIIPRTGNLGQFTGSEVMRLSGTTSPNLDLDWSNNGSGIASAEEQGFAYVWDAASGQLLFSQSIPNLRQIELSPDGQQLATLNLDFLSLNGAIQIWDIETGELLYTATISNEEVYALGWSPDGSQLAFSAEGESPEELVTIITVPNHETPTRTATDTSD